MGSTIGCCGTVEQRKGEVEAAIKLEQQSLIMESLSSQATEIVAAPRP